MSSSFKRYSLLLPIILILSFLLISNQESIQTNLLNLQLSKATYNSENDPNPNLKSRLTSPDFNSKNSVTTWWGGYYLLTQTNSFAQAESIWELSPAFSSDMLVRNANVAENKEIRLEAAKTAYKLAPTSMEAKYALVDALLQNEEWQQATQSLDEFLMQTPNDATLLAIRGYTEYKGGGSNEKAEELLLQAKSLDPSLIRTYLLLVNFNQSVNHYETVVTYALEGLQVAEQAKSWQAKSFEGFLVDAYLKLGQFNNAFVYLEPGLKTSPEATWWNYLAGQYYYKMGLYQEAVDYYLIAAKDSQDISIITGLGDSYLAIGDDPNAINAYCKALSIVPKFSLVLEKLNNLNAHCP